MLILKRFFALIALATMLFSLGDKSTVVNAHISEKSYMTGWYSEERNAYIVCRLIIHSAEDVCVNICAYSDEDVGGLLENGEMRGYNENMSSDTFILHEGTNDIIVVFVGDCGQNSKKADYEPPDDIIIKRV